MSDSKRYIRFIDSGYNTLFYVPDGGTVRVTHGYDGSVQEYACRYIDETHAYIGNNVYHICQFAELMERNGSTYEPTQVIGDLEFYPKRYFDRENLGDDGKPVPYYLLAERNVLNAHEKYSYCLNPASPEKAFCKFVGARYSFEEAVFPVQVSFAAMVEELCDDAALCAQINGIVEAIDNEQRRELGEVLRDAEARSGQVVDNQDEKEFVK